jgi:hypothetical protein
MYFNLGRLRETTTIDFFTESCSWLGSIAFGQVVNMNFVLGFWPSLNITPISQGWFN